MRDFLRGVFSSGLGLVLGTVLTIGVLTVGLNYIENPPAACSDK